MTTDPQRRRPHGPGLVPVFALGVLLVATVSCSSDGGDDRVATGTEATAATTTTSGPDAGPDAADGELALAVGRGGVTLTVTAGAEPLVVLADLSLAVVEADGSSWTVTIARPDGPRSSTSDVPDSFDGVVVQPGESVDVGPYELGPRPPTDLSLCLEVAVATAAQARAANGDEVLLPAAAEPPTTLCATTPVG